MPDTLIPIKEMKLMMTNQYLSRTNPKAIFSSVLLLMKKHHGTEENTKKTIIIWKSSQYPKGIDDQPSCQAHAEKRGSLDKSDPASHP